MSSPRPQDDAGTRVAGKAGLKLLEEISDRTNLAYVSEKE